MAETTVVSGSVQSDQASPGRPRDATVDNRVLRACFELLADRGYAGMSIADVARRAGVGRPTIYRRWPNKEELAVAALDHAQAGIVNLPDSGDLEADLAAHLASLRQTLTRPHGMAIIGSMLAEEHTTPALIAGFRSRVVPRRRAPMAKLFDRAKATGTLHDRVDVQLAVDLAVGACYARYISGAPFTHDWARRTARAVITAAQHADVLHVT